MKKVFTKTPPFILGSVIGVLCMFAGFSTGRLFIFLSSYSAGKVIMIYLLVAIAGALGYAIGRLHASLDSLKDCIVNKITDNIMDSLNKHMNGEK